MLCERFIIGWCFAGNFFESSIKRRFAVEANIQSNSVNGVRLKFIVVKPADKFFHSMFINVIVERFIEFLFINFESWCAGKPTSPASEASFQISIGKNFCFGHQRF